MADPIAEGFRAPGPGPSFASIAGEGGHPIPGATSPATQRNTGTRQGAPEENEEDHVSRIGRGLVRASLRVFGLISVLVLTILASAPAEARWKKRAISNARPPPRPTIRAMPTSWSMPIPATCCMHQSRTAPPSGFAHQDHDALSPVRAARGRHGSRSTRRWTCRPTPPNRRRPSSACGPGRRSRSRMRSRRW